MIRDITLGQFYNADSIIHRLDPRVKLCYTFVFLASLFLQKDIGLYIVATVFLVLYISLSKVPIGKIIKGLKPIMVILVMTALFNLFAVRGEACLWQWHFLKISSVSIANAIYISIRLIYLILGASIVTYTTTPTNLTDGLEELFAPLKKIGVPVHDLTMMMSIALRFIPILVDELDRVMKAQEARGARFHEGSLYQRLKAMLPIIIPLFVSAFKRANDLAMAMDARCYHGSDGRTKMYPLHYGRRDVIAAIILLLYSGCCATLVIMV